MRSSEIPSPTGFTSGRIAGDETIDPYLHSRSSSPILQLA
jgi:hypothetical protein